MCTIEAETSIGIIKTYFTEIENSDILKRVAQHPHYPCNTKIAQRVAAPIISIADQRNSTLSENGNKLFTRKNKRERSTKLQQLRQKKYNCICNSFFKKATPTIFKEPTTSRNQLVASGNATTRSTVSQSSLVVTNLDIPSKKTIFHKSNFYSKGIVMPKVLPGTLALEIDHSTRSMISERILNRIFSNTRGTGFLCANSSESGDISSSRYFETFQKRNVKGTNIRHQTQECSKTVSSTERSEQQTTELFITLVKQQGENTIIKHNAKNPDDVNKSALQNKLIVHLENGNNEYSGTEEKIFPLSVESVNSNNRTVEDKNLKTAVSNVCNKETMLEDVEGLALPLDLSQKSAVKIQDCFTEPGKSNEMGNSNVKHELKINYLKESQLITESTFKTKKSCQLFDDSVNNIAHQEANKDILPTKYEKERVNDRIKLLGNFARCAEHENLSHPELITNKIHEFKLSKTISPVDETAQNGSCVLLRKSGSENTCELCGECDFKVYNDRTGLLAFLPVIDHELLICNQNANVSKEKEFIVHDKNNDSMNHTRLNDDETGQTNSSKLTKKEMKNETISNQTAQVSSEAEGLHKVSNKSQDTHENLSSDARQMSGKSNASLKKSKRKKKKK